MVRVPGLRLGMLAPLAVGVLHSFVDAMSKRFPGVFRVAFKNRKGGKQFSRTWFIRYTHNGKQVRESTGTTDPEQAFDIRLRRLKELESGSIVTEPRKVTVEDLRKLVHANLDARGKVTAKRLHLWFDPILTYFGARPVIDVKPADLEAYISARKADGIAPGSVSVELRWLARGFKLAVMSDRLPRVPVFPKIEFDNARRVFADWPVVERLLPHLPAELRPVVLTAHFSGWRKDSVLNRERALHLDLEGRWLYLERMGNKGRAPVRIWLNETLLEALRAQDEIAKAIELKTGRLVPWLFFHYADGLRFEAGGRLKDITKPWDIARKAAGIPELHFHDLRRGAIRELRRDGSTENEIMAWTGIKSRSTFDRYDIVDEARIREVGERQQERHASRAGRVLEFFRKA